MKIVWFSPLNPFPPQTGGEQRIYNLAKYLSKFCELVLVVPREPGRGQPDFPIKLYTHVGRPRFQQLFDPRFFTRVAAVIRKEKPDHLLLEFPWHGLHLFLLSLVFRVPFSVDAHNVEGERKRLLGFPFWRIVKHYENWVLKRACRVFCVSEQDRVKFIQIGVPASRLRVIPNGADQSVFKFQPAKRESWRKRLKLKETEKAILFFGPDDYLPNRQAVSLIQHELVLRLDKRQLDYSVLIAGRGTERHNDCNRMKFLGRVDDLPGLIGAADVVVVPLVAGGGSRLKIVESLACGVPVVSTAVGAAGVNETQLKDNLAVVDDWDGFVHRIIEFVKTRRVPLNVPDGFWRVYDWGVIARRLVASLPSG